MSKFKRIVIKISGEVLAGERGFGIDNDMISFISRQIISAHETGTQISVVIGGGNIVRGNVIAKRGVKRVNSDRLGMISTILNCIAVSDAIVNTGINSVVLSSIPVEGVAEKYSVEKALKYLEDGYIVFFAGGTGNPFFSTDTLAVLRAAEIDADVVLKGTKVDGIYDKDPKRYKDAVKFEEISGNEVLARNIKVMDLTAFSLSIESEIPIIVFDLMEKDGIKRILLGEKLGTFVRV